MIRNAEIYAGHEYPGFGTVTGAPASSQAIIRVDAGVLIAVMVSLLSS